MRRASRLADVQDLPVQTCSAVRLVGSPLRDTSDLRNTSADNLILDAHGELLKTSRMQRASGLADMQDLSVKTCSAVRLVGSPLRDTSDLRNTSADNLILDAHGELLKTSRMQRASGLADMQDLPVKTCSSVRLVGSPLRDTSDLRNTSADNLILDAHGELLKTSRMQRASGLADMQDLPVKTCSSVRLVGSPLRDTSDLRNTSDANLILDAHGELLGTSRMQRESGLADMQDLPER